MARPLRCGQAEDVRAYEMTALGWIIAIAFVIVVIFGDRNAELPTTPRRSVLHRRLWWHMKGVERRAGEDDEFLMRSPSSSPAGRLTDEEHVERRTWR